MNFVNTMNRHAEPGSPNRELKPKKTAMQRRVAKANKLPSPPLANPTALSGERFRVSPKQLARHPDNRQPSVNGAPVEIEHGVAAFDFMVRRSSACGKKGGAS